MTSSRNMLDELIPIKKITIFIGMDNRGQIVGQTHSAMPPNVKLFVVPSKFFISEKTTPQGKVVKETPISPLGWEYVVEDEASFLGLQMLNQ